MKKIYLSLTLILGLMLFASQAWAITPIHEAEYLWYYSPGGGSPDYGTLVHQLFPTVDTWSYGDISGEVIVETREKFWTEYDEALGRDVGVFAWAMWNVDLTNILIPDPPDMIHSFAVTSMGYVPLEVLSPDGWDFEHTGGMYIWSADDPEDGIPAGVLLGGFGVTVDTTLWSISNGGIDYYNGEREVIFDGDGYWRVSHPGVPEPGSIALLGMGLLGFGGRMFRKRFKA